MRDQAAEYAAAWAAFEALDRPSAHRADFARWAAGRPRHTLFMALVHDRPAVAAIRDVQHALRDVHGLELHQPHFFHISLQSCGFGSELRVDEDRVQAELSALGPFEVVLGGVNAFHSAVILETHSGGHLPRLRQALRAALGPAIEAVDPQPGFLFHLTLGYLNGRASIEAVRRATRPLRGREVGRVRIDQVALIHVPTDQRVRYPDLAPARLFWLGSRCGRPQPPPTG